MNAWKPRQEKSGAAPGAQLQGYPHVPPGDGSPVAPRSVGSYEKEPWLASERTGVLWSRSKGRQRELTKTFALGK